MTTEFKKREVERALKWLNIVKKGYKLKIAQLEKAQKDYDAAQEKLNKTEDKTEDEGR